MFSGRVRQFLAGTSASLGAFQIGQTYAWTSPIIELLTSPQSPISMTQTEGSWVVTSMEFGCFAIPFFAGWLVDKIGRKTTLLITGPLYFLSWIMAIYTRNVYGLYGVRTVQGLCVSTITVVCPMYLGEVSETKIRGAIGTLFQVSMYTGILYVYIFGTSLSYTNYQIINLIPSILFMLTFIWIPESPYFYLKHRNNDKAYKSLKWFRYKMDENKIKDEFINIQTDFNNEKVIKTSFKSLLEDKTNLKCIFIIAGVLFIRTFTHIQTLMAYASTTFGATGQSFISPDYVSILYSIILLLSIFPATYLVDKAGRKILLIISTLGCGIFSFISFIYYFLHEIMHYNLSIYWNYINFISICCLGISYNLGLGPLYSPLTCEYFSSSTRALSCSILTFIGTSLQFIEYNVFYILYIYLGMYSNFLLSFIICFICLIWIKFYIKDTKGKTFAQIQEIYSNNKNIKDFPTCTEHRTTTL